MGYNDEEYRSPRASRQYTSPKNKRKRKTKGQQLEESGEYLQDPETQDTSKPLESRMFDIDPKKHKQAGKTEKIYKKATNPQAQGSEKEWVKKTGAQLPPILESREMDEIYAKDKEENKEFDEAVARGDLKEGVRIRQAGKLLRDSWEDTKAFKHWSNLPHNIGAVGARGLESFFTIDADNPKEVALELIQKVGNPRKGLAGEIIGEIPGVKVAIRQIKKEAFDFAKRIMPNGYKAKYAMAGGGEIVGEAAEQTAKAKPLMSKSVDPTDGSINLGPSGKPLQHTAGNPYLTHAERKGMYPLPSKDEVIRRQKLGRDWQSIDAEKVSTLSDANKRDWSLYERDEAAYFQNPRWPRDQEFNKLGDVIKSELEKLYPDIPLSYWRNHHTNPVKQGARLLNGLKPEFREKGIKILLEEGLFAGHDPKQLAVIPKEIHRKIHRFINERVGKKYSVNYLESTLPKGVKLEDVPWPDREQFVRLYARAIKDSQTKIYDMMTALAVNKKYGPNVLPEVLANLNSKVDATDVGLDDLLKQIKSELNLQEISGTVPKINLQKLAEQYTTDSSIQTRLLKDLASGKYTRKQLKRKYPGFKAEQLDLFDK